MYIILFRLSCTSQFHGGVIGWIDRHGANHVGWGASVDGKVSWLHLTMKVISLRQSVY